MIDNSTEIYSIRRIFNNYRNNVVSVDLDRYKHLLDDPSLSEAEKDEFLKALWSIITSFIDLGFGVHPLQEIVEADSSMDLKQAFDSAESTDSNSENYEGDRLTENPEVM